MNKTGYRTDRLFVRGSFFIGMGSLLAIFSPYYSFNYSKSSSEADKKALESDFGMIGLDLQNAFVD